MSTHPLACPHSCWNAASMPRPALATSCRKCVHAAPKIQARSLTLPKHATLLGNTAQGICLHAARTLLRGMTWLQLGYLEPMGMGPGPGPEPSRPRSPLPPCGGVPDLPDGLPRAPRPPPRGERPGKLGPLMRPPPPSLRRRDNNHMAISMIGAAS